MTTNIDTLIPGASVTLAAIREWNELNREHYYPTDQEGSRIIANLRSGYIEGNNLVGYKVTEAGIDYLRH